jgi:pyruvate kinase
MNLINKDVPMPSLTDEDKNRLSFAEEVTVDFVALSFVREKADIDYLQKELNSRGIKSKIISKVESQKGVNNIDEIIDASYGVMIARGDLGIETPIEGIAYLQKEMIRKCKLKSKPVIVATQMLESMINNKFPTRAEAGDVANAVFDSTDAVMLSGETAYGSYPVEVVNMMSKICSYNEKLIKSSGLTFEEFDNTKYIATSAYTISENSSKINKIVVLTETGYTPRVISSLRPDADIIAVSDFQDSVNWLSMSYGITAFKTKYSISDLNSFQFILDELVEHKIIYKGDSVVAIHGQKFGQPGGTNSLFIVTV